MRLINTQDISDVSIGIRNCCGNCVYNLWDENGPHCRNSKNINQELVDTIEDGNYDDDGLIFWFNYCKHHRLGKPMNSYYNLLIMLQDNSFSRGEYNK
jgi:hypothetical protein